MRAYCQEASSFGEQLCPQGTSLRHVTVIMNSHTKGSKGLYEEYAAPLLHLAGLKVSLFKTEHSGQAKELMQIMDNTDAVIVVGGDGTLMEAVTGLLTRDDRTEACRRFPIGVIPTGKTNTLARRLYFTDQMKAQQLAAEAAMAAIKDVKRPIDAFRVDFLNENLWHRVEDQEALDLKRKYDQDLEAQGFTVEDSTKAEELAEVDVQTAKDPGEAPYLKKVDPVFGVGKLEYGIFRDLDATIDRYWYFGSLRARAAYFFGHLRQSPEPVETEICFSDVCLGCNRCMVMSKKAEQKQPHDDTQNQRWWSSFVKREQPKSGVDPNEKFANVVNENCGNLTNTSICYTNLEVAPSDGSLVVKVSPATLTSIAVLSDGIARHSKYVTPCIQEQLRVSNIQFNFPQKELFDPEYIPTGEEKRSKELFFKGKKISVDSEVFARQPISVTLYPKAVTFFVKS